MSITAQKYDSNCYFFYFYTILVTWGKKFSAIQTIQGAKTHIWSDWRLDALIKVTSALDSEERERAVQSPNTHIYCWSRELKRRPFCPKPVSLTGNTPSSAVEKLSWLLNHSVPLGLSVFSKEAQHCMTGLISLLYTLTLWPCNKRSNRAKNDATNLQRSVTPAHCLENNFSGKTMLGYQDRC